MNLVLAPLRPDFPNRARVGLVLGGYFVAFTGATLATYLRILYTQGPEAQASSGMYAFGDSLVWLVVFSLLASVPTALALVYLRGVHRFWVVSAWLALALAATGVVASFAYVVTAGRPLTRSTLDELGTLAPLRFLLAPILAGAFGMFALLAPAPGAKRLFVVAALVESAAGAAAFVRLLWMYR